MGSGSWGGSYHHNKEKGVTFIVPLLCASHQAKCLHISSHLSPQQPLGWALLFPFSTAAFLCSLKQSHLVPPQGLCTSCSPCLICSFSELHKAGVFSSSALTFMLSLHGYRKEDPPGIFSLSNLSLPSQIPQFVTPPICLCACSLSVTSTDSEFPVCLSTTLSPTPKAESST